MLVAGGRLRSSSGLSLEKPALGLRSYYAPWILADLAQWADTGITKVCGLAIRLMYMISCCCCMMQKAAS